MTSTVTFEGFPLTGATPGGGRAKIVGQDGLAGWFSKTYRRTRDSRAGQDGGRASLGLLDALPVTIRGQIVYSSAAAAAVERRQLLTLGGRDSAALAVTDAGGTGTRYVETDYINVSPQNHAMLEYTISVTAVDPLLYGNGAFAQAQLSATGGSTGRVWPRVWPTSWGVAPGVTPGAVTVANAGTASYYPRLRLDGPMSNPVLTMPETGDVVRIGTSIAAGQHVDINMGDPRRVTIGDNPVSIRGLVTYSGNFLAVPPGGASITISDDTGSSLALLSVWSYEGAWQ